MAKARPSSAEIDRFLEEVNRRKQQARKAPPPPPVVQQPPRPKPQQPRQQVKVQQKQVLIEEPVVRTVVIESLPEPPRDLPVRATSAYQLPVAQPAQPRGSLSAPVQHAMSLLRSRDGLRAMFVMNEILSPPRSVQPYGNKR